MAEDLDEGHPLVEPSDEVSYCPQFDPLRLDDEHQVLLLPVSDEEPECFQLVHSAKPEQNGPWPRIVMFKPLFPGKYEFDLEWVGGGGCFNLGFIQPDWNPKNRKDLKGNTEFWNTKGLTSDRYEVVLDYDEAKWSIKSKTSRRSHYDGEFHGFPKNYVFALQIFNCKLRIHADEPEVLTKGAGKLQ